MYIFGADNLVNGVKLLLNYYNEGVLKDYDIGRIIIIDKKNGWDIEIMDSVDAWMYTVRYNGVWMDVEKNTPIESDMLNKRLMSFMEGIKEYERHGYPYVWDTDLGIRFFYPEDGFNIERYTNDRSPFKLFLMDSDGVDTVKTVFK